MLILSRVCAVFHDKSGQPIFNIHPENLLSFLTAPDTIREDPLFAMMMADGSLEAVQSVSRQRELENDPAAGVTAEGKKAAPESQPASAPASESRAALHLAPTAEPAKPAPAGAADFEPTGAAEETAKPDASDSAGETAKPDASDSAGKTAKPAASDSAAKTRKSSK